MIPCTLSIWHILTTGSLGLSDFLRAKVVERLRQEEAKMKQ